MTYLFRGRSKIVCLWPQCQRNCPSHNTSFTFFVHFSIFCFLVHWNNGACIKNPSCLFQDLCLTSPGNLSQFTHNSLEVNTGLEFRKRNFIYSTGFSLSATSVTVGLACWFSFTVTPQIIIYAQNHVPWVISCFMPWSLMQEAHHMPQYSECMHLKTMVCICEKVTLYYQVWIKYNYICWWMARRDGLL